MLRPTLSVLTFLVPFLAASAWPKKATSDKRSLLLEDPEVYFPTNVEEIPVRYLPRKALKLEVSSEGRIQGLQTGTLAQNQEESDGSEVGLHEDLAPKAARPEDQVEAQLELNSLGRGQGSSATESEESEESKFLDDLEDKRELLEADKLEDKHEEMAEQKKDESDESQAKKLRVEQLQGLGALESRRPAVQVAQCRDSKIFRANVSGVVWKVAWSPDAVHIAFRIGWYNTPSTQGFVFRTDGTEQPQGLGKVSSVSWSRTGQLMVSNASKTECSVSYWGPDDGQWQELKAPAPIRFEQKGCSDISWSPDEVWWAVSSFPQSPRSKAVMHVYHLLEGELQQQTFSDTGITGTMLLRMSPNSQNIFAWKHASNKQRGVGFLWIRNGSSWHRVNDFQCTFLEYVHGTDYLIPEWSPDSKWLAVPESHSLFQIGEGGKWKRIRRLPGHSAWSPQNRLAVSVKHFGNSYQVWNLGAQNARLVMENRVVTEIGRIRSMAWSPNGQHLACGGNNGRIMIAATAGPDAFALKDTKISSGTDTGSRGMSWSPDGIYLATAWESLLVWRVGDGLSMVCKQEGLSEVLAVAWSPKSSRLELATAQLNDELQIWRMEGNELIRKSSTKMDHTRHWKGRFYVISWSPDGQELATTGCFDKNVKIWKQRTDTLEHQITLKGQCHLFGGVSWSATGHLATGSSCNIMIWMKFENTWKVVQEIPSSVIVQVVSWSPDGLRLVASFSESGIRVWRYAAQKLEFEGDLKGIVGGPRFFISWAPDSKQFVALANSENNPRLACHHGRLEEEWQAYPFGEFEPALGSLVAWSPNYQYIGLGYLRRSDSQARIPMVKLYQATQPAIGSWPAQMFSFEKDPSSCDESTCVPKKMGLVELHLVANTTEVAWGMFPCSRSHSMWGQHRYNLISLTLRWPKRHTTWSKAIKGADDLCSRVFASFEHLESLRLEEPKVKGRFSCEEQKMAGALKKLEIVGGLMEIPAWSLESFMHTSPDLKQVKLVKMTFPALEGSPGHNLGEIALQQTDLRGIAKPFLAADLLLDCPGNPNLQLPYTLMDGCEVAEDIGPVCLEQRPSPDDDKVEFQAFVLQEESWVKGARLRVDRSRLCEPGFVYQINAGKSSGCEPCPADTFSSNNSVSEDVKMICLPCKENQVTNGTATSLDDCLCVEKYAKDGTDCRLCSELPQGEAYECRVVGLRVETVPVKEGFWRDNDTIPLRCGRRGEPSNGCQGGPPGDICRSGHNGFKCRQCEEFRFLREGECVRCTTDQLQNPSILFDLAVAGSLVFGSAFAFRLARRRLRSAGESPELVRDLLQPPKPQDSLTSYLVREVMAAIQVYQLFGVLSKILPQKKQRVEARFLESLDIGPVLLDGLHLDCVMPFTTSRLLQLLIDPLLPLPLLLGFYLSIYLTVQDKEKRSKMWTNFSMKAFNILLIPTVGSIFNAGICDSDSTPPVMMTVPEVSCRSLTYFQVSLFVSCLGIVYLVGAMAMILRTLARYNHVMRDAKFLLPCHSLDEEAKVLKIHCAGQGGGELQCACLDAAQIHYQQLLERSKLSVADVPSDANYRLLAVENPFSPEVAATRLTERSVAYFKALVVRCVLLQLEREDRHGDIRGMTDVLTKFCPDSFHFLLFLKVGQVLIAYVPSLEGNRAQGAVGSFVCAILAIGLLSQPYSRPSEGRTLFAGLLALGLAFLMVMLSETHLNMQGEESLTKLMQIARCFQVVPMMRVLIPVSCFFSTAQRERSVDFKQEQLLRTTAWKYVARHKRQPFCLSKPANLELSDLPMTIKKGTVVLPLRCLEKHMEVEVRTHDRVVTGLVPLAALKKQPVAVKDLNSAVAQLKAEKVPATSDWTKHAGSGPTIWYNSKTQEIAWSEPKEMPEDKGPLWRVAIDFKSKVALSAIRLTNTKGSRPSLAVHSTDTGIWPVPDNVQDINFPERIEMKEDKHFLQYHLHCDVNHCTLLLSGDSQPDSIELGDASSSSAWKLTILGDVRSAPKARPE